MSGPPRGTGSPWSVAGSAANAWLGTWQVPQLWAPEAERLLPMKSALPATAAAEAEASSAGGSAEELSPPQADRAPAPAIAVSTLQRRVHHSPPIALIRTVPTQVCHTC